MDPLRKDFHDVRDPIDVKKTLIKLAGDNLMHRAGESFAAATRTCLEYNPKTDIVGKRANALKDFRDGVITPLDEACMLK